MAKELKDMTKAELLGHIDTLEKNLANSGTAGLQKELDTANAKLATANGTIEELMTKVSKLDAVPKANTNTIEIGGKTFVLRIPKSYLKKADGKMVLAGIDEIKADAELQASAMTANILVEQVIEA